MYKEEDLVRIAKRENNKKRTYLVVNALQGKHIPVEPQKAFSMFQELADTLREDYTQERLLLIGFAETATAIGAAVAVELGTKYIQTTREIIPDVEYMFFSEEHSHATEQKLVQNDMDSIIEEIDRIIFIEDEVTTGKTILNIIQILEKQYPKKIKFSVASLLNGMDENALRIYAEQNIKLHYLVKTNHEPYSEIADSFAGNGAYMPCNKDAREVTQEICIGAWMNARRLVSATEYEKACETLWQGIDNALQGKLSGRVLVLGTEEFMYPALYVAKRIEQSGAKVLCHSTTRSPIAVSLEETYPLHVRYELRSLYDSERITYLYDIASYDAVLIVTDAHKKGAEETDGIHSLVNAVCRKNENVFLVRWC